MTFVHITLVYVLKDETQSTLSQIQDAIEISNRLQNTPTTSTLASPWESPPSPTNRKLSLGKHSH
jgi:hypothetical protein